MVNLKQLNKEELGKKLMPSKIYNFKFKEVFEDLYEKLYFDNVHYEINTRIDSSLLFRTKKDIEKGEELIIDYGDGWIESRGLLDGSKNK